MAVRTWRLAVSRHTAASTPFMICRLLDCGKRRSELTCFPGTPFVIRNNGRERKPQTPAKTDLSCRGGQGLPEASLIDSITIAFDPLRM